MFRKQLGGPVKVTRPLLLGRGRVPHFDQSMTELLPMRLQRLRFRVDTQCRP